MQSSSSDGAAIAVGPAGAAGAEGDDSNPAELGAGMNGEIVEAGTAGGLDPVERGD